MTSHLRPDERAVNADIERNQRFDKSIKNAGKSVLSLATGGTAVGLTSKVIPFLSEHIPTALAIKGINKISPKLGGFLQHGMSEGLDVKEGLNFIKDKINASQEPPKQNRNIIEQYSPELHKIISDGIKKGKSPLQAAIEAVSDSKFAKIVQKIAGDHGTSFSAILESVYGPSNESSRSTNPFSTSQTQGQSSSQPQESASNQQPQPGQGQQALMAILQKIQQSRGGR